MAGGFQDNITNFKVFLNLDFQDTKRENRRQIEEVCPESLRSKETLLTEYILKSRSHDRILIYKITEPLRALSLADRCV